MAKKIVLSIVILLLIVSLVCIAFCQEIPDGFMSYTVQPGDVLGKLAPSSHWEIIRKVNRIDDFHLPAGKKILIPKDLEKAKEFMPVPDSIEDLAGYDRVLVVLLDIQYFGAYEQGQLSFWGPICSGKQDSTPRGRYQVLWKKKDYVSKKYAVAMPHAVSFSDEGYFFHEQSLVGRPVSHGCVRLLKEDAKKIFHWIKLEDTVIIE